MTRSVTGAVAYSGRRRVELVAAVLPFRSTERFRPRDAAQNRK
ncbi:hypothetical protein [Haladaptatus sp. T7]|nr:hypothetical protein [Haladaptatus sp. T7]